MVACSNVPQNRNTARHKQKITLRTNPPSSILFFQLLRTKLPARRLKRTSEETSGQIESREMRTSETRTSRLIDKRRHGGPSRRKRRNQTISHVRLSGSHAALHHVPQRAMMAGHFFFVRRRRRISSWQMMMPAMGQAAHPIAVSPTGIVRARQQSQWRSQQRDNHQNCLHPAHRRKFYHSASRLASTSHDRAAQFPHARFAHPKTSRYAG